MTDVGRMGLTLDTHATTSICECSGGVGDAVWCPRRLLTRHAWADDIPQELIPDPQGELKLFDAAGNQVDYKKLNKITDPYNQNISSKGDFPIDGKHLSQLRLQRN